MRSLIIRPIQAGFTLVELLIVVIIIAILAAIVVPQFSTATADAQEAALDANLAGLRSAIELYRVQHGGVYPSAVSGSDTCSATAGATTAGAQAFIDQMLLYSNSTGQTCSANDSKFRFGPYYRRDRGFPSDPITKKGSAAGEINVVAGSAPLVTTTGTPPVSSCTTCTAAGPTAGGWNYASGSGQIVMNSGANDSKGQPYFTH